MRRNLALAGLVLVVGLGISGVASAGDSGFGNVGTLETKAREIFGFLGKVALGAFILVCVYVVITSLVEAKKNGGFQHVAVALLFVVIAGVGVWTLLAWGNQDPNQLSEGIRAR
jgi:hypothetical protein